MTFKLGFVEGVTPTKWIGIWKDRFADVGIVAFGVSEGDQLAPLTAEPDTDAAADVLLVRLPLNTPAGLELSVIPLYEEVAVVVVPKDHAIAEFDELTLAEVAELAGRRWP